MRCTAMYRAPVVISTEISMAWYKTAVTPVRLQSCNNSSELANVVTTVLHLTIDMWYDTLLLGGQPMLHPMCPAKMHF